MKLISSLLFVTWCLVACNSNKTNQNQNTNQVLKTDQSEISYNISGEGEVTLLFVHGWNINKSYWDQQQAKFHENYQIVAIDLPGFGGSKNLKPTYAIDSYANDIKALINHLELDKVVLIGHSMGGRIILEAAQDNESVIALVGVDNYKEVQQKLNDELKAEADGFVEWLRADFANNSAVYVDQYLIFEGTDSLVRKRIVKDYKMANPEASIPAIQTYLDYPYSEQERLTNLNVPLFLISSDMSPVDTVGLKSTGLDFRVFEMSQTGHFPMVEQPKQFNEFLAFALKDFKQKIN
ncbi:alpha/beta fold hydrolase [Reichenbachiella sp.]|uniref:alpha/beta fold hydrolase n=1 Tax=Reichenbachiella sp. TaxID=2184521 RepID=UPI003BAF5E63